MVQWLELSTFTARAQGPVQPLVGELRSRKPRGKKIYIYIVLDILRLLLLFINFRLGLSIAIT